MTSPSSIAFIFQHFSPPEVKAEGLMHCASMQKKSHLLNVHDRKTREKNFHTSKSFAVDKPDAIDNFSWAFHRQCRRHRLCTLFTKRGMGKKDSYSLLTIQTPYTACPLNCTFPTARQYVDVSACDILLPLVSNLWK